MKGKGIKVFGVIMSLLLVLSFAATFMVSSTSVVSAGTQKWTKISIPDTDDMQLAPGTDVGAIAVSPDGETLFAAVIGNPTAGQSVNPDFPVGNWKVLKSVDDGYTWSPTTYVGDGTPLERIVAIKISPAWEDDGIIVVATTADAYVSDDRGKTWTSMTGGAGFASAITCLDIGLDNDGDATFVVGTDTGVGDVYILSGFSGWVAQSVSKGSYSSILGVLGVAFSPNYAEDGVVYAIIHDTSQGTVLRAESDIDNHNWGDYILDAFFQDEDTGDPIGATAFSTTLSACMDFADDYNSAPAIFVGLTAYYDADGIIDFPDANAATVMEPRGDAFVVDLVSATIGTSAVTDLNIRRGFETRTNVVSIQAAGSSTSAFLLVGLRDMANMASMTTWSGQVHYSANGGESWLQCYKPPAGIMLTPQLTAPIVLMAPDFDADSDSAKAYCSNGYIPGFAMFFSGFHVSTTKGTSFNGRGLLDHSIGDFDGVVDGDVEESDTITDVVPSPDYDTDSTLFMVTSDIGYLVAAPGLDMGLLWETKDGGKQWELILGMTTMIPVPGVSIAEVEIPQGYPTEPSIFVTGPLDPLGGVANFMVRSVDEGNLFTTVITGKNDDATPPNKLPVETWKVIDRETLIISNANNIWKTTNGGARWISTDDSDIAATETIIDMQIWNDTVVIVGTDQGNIYICQNWETDFSFTQVGSGPGIASDQVHVAFDTNYDDNGIIYAGVNGDADTQGIWRIDANSGDDWEQIDEGNDDILSIACDGNGILWAIADRGVATWPIGGPLYRSTSLREVNPTAPIDDLNFEYVITGLTANLWTDLETAPTQTYVFAIGGGATAGAAHPELWAYIDTLIKPTLISPADGATAAGTILQGNAMALVSLRWEEMPKATMYKYEVAYDSEFGSIAYNDVLTDEEVEGTQATIQLFLGEKYYWRVRSISPVVSQWSDVWTFTTPLGPASSKPVITYPGSQDSHYDIPLKPTLTWTSAVECTGYELIVAKQCDWANPLINLTGSSALGTDTCYTITQSLLEGTNYCWKVRAINDDTGTASPWSDTGTFTTIVVEVEEEEGTPIWVWVVIALSAVLLVGVVVLIIRTRRPV